MKKNLLGISLIIVTAIIATGCGSGDKAEKISQKEESVIAKEVDLPNLSESASLNESDEANNIEEISDTTQIETEIVEDTIYNEIVDNIEEKDLSKYFHGINGCAVIYESGEKQGYVYNKGLAEKETSPYSTFKIMATLMGIRNGVLTSEETRMKYSGREYPMETWNADLTLYQAVQASCVWYFRQVIDQVGQEEVEKELKGIRYGNCDVSEWKGSEVNPTDELNGFWLGSSLKISPIEQVVVQKKIWEGETIYTEHDLELLQKVLLYNETEDYQVYGKTGTGPNGNAWFVGMAYPEENIDSKVYFAIYLEDETKKEEINSQLARQIALEIIQNINK